MVFITDSGDVSTVVQAMRDGAVDFLMKPIEADQLIAAVTRGLQKGKGAETKRQMRDTFLSRVEMLTARERQVAMRLVAGRSNKQIASELGTTEKTAKVHRGHVMAKLQVGSVAELIRLAEETRPSPICTARRQRTPHPLVNAAQRSRSCGASVSGHRTCQRVSRVAHHRQRSSSTCGTFSRGSLAVRARVPTALRRPAPSARRVRARADDVAIKCRS